jgi:hypothetical protein
MIVNIIGYGVSNMGNKTLICAGFPLVFSLAFHSKLQFLLSLLIRIEIRAEERYVAASRISIDYISHYTANVSANDKIVVFS